MVGLVHVFIEFATPILLNTFRYCMNLAITFAFPTSALNSFSKTGPTTHGNCVVCNNQDLAALISHTKVAVLPNVAKVSQKLRIGGDNSIFTRVSTSPINRSNLALLGNSAT